MSMFMHHIRQTGSRLLTLVSLFLISAQVWATSQPSKGGAGLPEAQQASREGDTIQKMIQNHLYDAGVLAGLAVATIAFIIVAISAIKVFSAVQDGRKSWTDFAAVILVGGVLLVLTIWLLTQAASIL